MNIFIGLFAACLSFEALADCRIVNSIGTAVKEHSDVLFAVISSLEDCPKNVFDLKTTLQNDGLKTKPSMVANRGRHNPALGSFSFFEIAAGRSSVMEREISQGHLYFGHFTHETGGKVDLDQSPARGKLLIELIAWDFKKEMYNFYELIGTGGGATWFYRGDSRDAFLDNRLLHLQPDPARPQFGKRMRCSACHSSGGPIMKELELPYNDWWTVDRPLPFGVNKPSSELSKWLANTMDAAKFSEAVTRGIDLLEQSAPIRTFKQSLSLQELLRPLFCTTEVNLVSDAVPFDGVFEKIAIPSQYFVNPLLSVTDPIEIDKNAYIRVLQRLRFKFPEITRIDADHAWLAPVKGHSDLSAIRSLVGSGIIDAEIGTDILAIDFNEPLFSQNRCKLLRLVPKVWEAAWITKFVANLRNDGSSTANMLLDNITADSKTAAFHKKQATDYVRGLAVSDFEGVQKLIMQLDQKRTAVFSIEISRNPLGQILEPGFRVIFPVRVAN